MSKGLFSPLEVSASLYNLKMFFNNEVLKSKFDFISFYKFGML